MFFSTLTRMVTQFFSIQLRKDRTLAPPPSLKESSRELTAGAPELDVLLKVHLQVCKALLQVAEGPGWGLRVKREGLAGGPARGQLSLQRADPEVSGEHGAGMRGPFLGASETEEVPLWKVQARPG